MVFIMSKRVLSNMQWRDLVSRLLKSEMSKRKLKYEDLSRALAEEGVIQTASNLRNKINRGILGADLLVQLLVVLNVKSVERQTLVEIMEDLKGI
jgi:hypothetical protein